MLSSDVVRFTIKVVLSAFIIAGVSEIGKRFQFLAAILASLPLTSILAMTWLYHDTGDIQKVVQLSFGILWALLPSLIFFIIFPAFLKSGMRFGKAMILSCCFMSLTYGLYVFVLKKLGIQI